MRSGMTFSIRKLATAVSGYVTASICWQPIQPGLKKSSRMVFLSAVALARAAFRLVSQVNVAMWTSLWRLLIVTVNNNALSSPVKKGGAATGEPLAVSAANAYNSVVGLHNLLKI